MNISALAAAYMADPDSPFQKLRPCTQANYRNMCARLERDCGSLELDAINARAFLGLHRSWAEGGKIPIAHSLVGMIRSLMTFGATLLEDAECRRLKTMLHDMRFEMPKARKERITAEQATAIRAAAHAAGDNSVALAQAVQFECILRQKDVIGEYDDCGWHRGVRWEEIDENWILTHVTSKKQKEVVVDLRLSPMVTQELRIAAGLGPEEEVSRRYFPASGPLIINERTGLPWAGWEFRRVWRKCADAAGVPREVFNMDTRAGAISEATDTGLSLEMVRHAATHSNTSTTARYSRGTAQKVVEVQKARVAHREVV